MAVYFWGQRDGGRVEECDGTYVETRYFHLQFFPLTAQSSILRLGDESFRIPTHRPSARIGFARFYFLVLSVGLVGVGLTQGGAAMIALCTAGVIGFALWIRAMRAGKLSPDELAQRRVYRAVTGYSADPALVVHANPTLTKHLHVELAARAEQLAPNGYRDALIEWSSVATHGGEVDLPFLAIALTLARIEGRDEVHRAVWERLAPAAASIPATIVPRTTVEAAPAAPPPAWSQLPTPQQLATAAGSFVEQGFDVVVPRKSYEAPPLCASCLQPAHLVRASFKSSYRVNVPYCTSCTQHATQQNAGNALGKVLTLGGALGFAALAFVGGPSLPVSLALVLFGASAAALSMAYLFPVRRASAPATMTLDAARLVASDDEHVTLFCKNEEWSQRLAEHFGGTRRENKRIHPRSLLIPTIAVVVATSAGAGAWFMNNPKVRIDNGTGAAALVWVDGRVVAEAAPTKGAETTDVRLPRGKHSIGWSKAGASGPTEKTDAVIELAGGDYVFDPASHHCYWVDAMVYGKDTANDQLMGARTVGLFHDFSYVKDWFVKSPDTTEVSSSSGGAVRYSLQRADCDEVRKCPAGVREKYWTCLVGATEVGVQRCKAEAAKACGWDETEE